VDSKRVLRELEKEFKESGKVKILKGKAFRYVKGSSVAVTDRGHFRFEIFVNCAGAYADRVAHAFGLAENYSILPFKGTYKKLKKEKSYLVRGNIYPVPDIRNPFLGVHFTKSYDGSVYIGPTAIPALGRENYGILKGLSVEVVNILIKNLIMFVKNERFRRIALTEPKKYVNRFFFEDIKDMVKELEPSDIIPSEKVGIRPQLVDWDKKELVMDFLVIKDSNSIHILNAISPAFTSSFAFARYIIENYIKGGKDALHFQKT